MLIRDMQQRQQRHIHTTVRAYAYVCTMYMYIRIHTILPTVSLHVPVFEYLRYEYELLVDRSTMEQMYRSLRVGENMESQMPVRCT